MFVWQWQMVRASKISAPHQPQGGKHCKAIDIMHGQQHFRRADVERMVISLAQIPSSSILAYFTGLLKRPRLRQDERQGTHEDASHNHNGVGWQLQRFFVSEATGEGIEKFSRTAPISNPAPPHNWPKRITDVRGHAS